LIPPIDEAKPTTIRIIDVEKHKEVSRVNIENLTQVKNESLEEHMLKPTKFISMNQDFVKCTTWELKQEFSIKVCDGELEVEKMQSGKLENNMIYYSIWKEY
jgi:hypothetical protein